MNVESSRYLDIADFERQELDVLADAIGVLLDLRQMHEVQAMGTADALDDLRKVKDAVVFPQIAKPQVFLAFPVRAEEDVVGVLKAVLHEQGDLRVVSWDQIDATGKVTVQIEEAITSSQFGVCYLSEPDGSGRFRDNTNVLFEAGMLNARSMSTQEHAAWLPIREEDSPPLPFDIAGDRIEPVPRADGRLNEQLFRARLRVRLKQLKTGVAGGFP